MKNCSCCHALKPLNAYYKGYAKCKACVCAAERMRRLKNVERVREYDRQRGRTEKRKARVKANAHKYKHKRAEYIKRHRAKYPEKYKARTALGNALRSGKILKGVCEMCGNPKVNAHHDDYSKPLEVRWLCTTHHGEIHRTS